MTMREAETEVALTPTDLDRIVLALDKRADEIGIKGCGHCEAEHNALMHLHDRLDNLSRKADRFVIRAARCEPDRTHILFHKGNVVGESGEESM